MEWEEEFDEFVKEKNISIEMDGLVSPMKEMKSFIKLALESQMSDLRKEVVEEVMKIIEKHDPSTGRETSPRYWGNTLRDEVLLLMQKKIINSH